MAIVIGVVLSAVVACWARFVKFDRDRAFYPTIVVVVASYYVLFAAMSGSLDTVAAELVGLTLFMIAAVVGFRSSPSVVVAALAGHGIYDTFHSLVVHNTGMPEWWPAFCASYDLAAAGWLALILRQASMKRLAAMSNEKSMVCPSVARVTSDVNETSVAQIYTACW